MIQSICVDTLTGIQSIQYMRDKKKPGHDKWKDYGQAIYTFMDDLMELGFEVVLILGEPGTGKSSGMRTLDPDTNIWFNADKKNPVWTGGRQVYGTKVKPKEPFHMIPRTYRDILDHIKEGLEGGKFTEDRVAFLTGHTETFRAGNETRLRLKTLGNMATDMQLEGRLETVLYAKVELSPEGEREYLLHTQNDGTNTARSPMGVFEGKIPNDYKMVLEGILGQ